MSNQVVKEPLIHITKRDDMAASRKWIIRIVSILLSLVVCAAFIYMLVRLNPLSVYKEIAAGAVGTTKRLWITIRDALTLLMVSIAVTPAFRMRFWNIGAEGQILMGCLASAALMIVVGDALPTYVLLAIMFAASFLSGLIWGIIPAVFKAKWNTNETLFTLMMNYAAMQVVNFFIITWEKPVGSGTVGIINGASKSGWMPSLFGLDYGWNLLIVLGMTLAVYIYMSRTKHGYEIAVVGESQSTAKYAGMNVKKIILRTAGLSGGLCGIAGFILVSASSHTISTGTAGGRGFTAIIVSWLAKFNVWVMAVIAFLLVFLDHGSVQIATAYNLNENASDVITGIILFFVIGCEFFINYRINFRKKHQ